jgi:hypothetical protein
VGKTQSLSKEGNLAFEKRYSRFDASPCFQQGAKFETHRRFAARAALTHHVSIDGVRICVTMQSLKITLLVLQLGFPLPSPPAPAAQRTEAEARRVAERNRAERERRRLEAGAPVELIPNYVRAQISLVPASLGVSPFYKKYVDAQGIPVVSSERVPDDALLVARDIVITMLSARPDIRKKMIERGWRTGVIAETEMTADMPEYANRKRPGAPRNEPVTQADRDYHAWRSRGLGGNPTTGAEENLLGYPGTRYYGEHIFVHEFSHAIMSSLRLIEPETGAAIQKAYDEAKAAAKYIIASTNQPHYAMTDANEYWAEGVQWWFFSNYGECFTGNVKIDTPDEFKAYDPKLYELISRVFDTHRIPMDVYHGKQVRKVVCPDH